MFNLILVSPAELLQNVTKCWNIFKTRSGLVSNIINLIIIVLMQGLLQA